jgi:uncharacterized protein YcaQ
VVSFSPLQARRIALAAQGFTRARPSGPVTARHLNAVIARLGFFQIDSVNVLQRAQYMPLFSRLGSYDVELLHRAAGRAPRRLFEYWAHEAALVDVRFWPALQFRMQEMSGLWGGPRRIAAEQPELVARVLEEVRVDGPMTAREIEHDAPRVRDNWGWNWSEVKQALEYLFYAGQVTAARRNGQFERVYDVPERVLPPDVLERPPLDPDEAHVELVRHAATALGIASAQCLRDYFRLRPEPTRRAIEALVDTGELEPASITGWKRPVFLHVDAARPRRVRARALLSPFDPLIFERTRTEVLFDFRYRIEIYVPEHKRVHGYYVLPFLLGDRLVARVDLKADRAAGVLRVKGAWAEPHAPEATASELADELALLAGWLGLDSVSVSRRGELATALATAVRAQDARALDTA